MKRVLIIKLWALGDILMATPLLTALRQSQPEMHITWIVDSAHADILAGHPLIDEVMPLDSRAWRLHLRRGNLLGWLHQGRDLNRQMRERQFDAAINCHPEKWWTRWLCAAPVRIGLYPSGALPLSRLAYTLVIPKPPPPRHNTDHYLTAAEALGATGPFDRRMRLTVSAADRVAVTLFLESAPPYQPGKPLVVLHPGGTSQPSKCWPAASYAAVADRLRKDYNVVITGSSKEQALAEAVVGAMQPPNAVVAAGRFSIGETAALIEKATAVVTGDTSLLHIASALEIPLVGIYGSTRPGDNTPLFGPHMLLFDPDIPCAPCYQFECPLRGRDHLRCQHGVMPAQVLAALHTLLKETHEHRLPA